MGSSSYMHSCGRFRLAVGDVWNSSELDNGGNERRLLIVAGSALV